MTVPIRTARPGEHQRVLGFLQSTGLPWMDVGDTTVFLVAARDCETLAGVVGLDTEAGLLRSLAVGEVARGQGLGRRLVAAAEAEARASGMKSLHLLTTDARGFFESCGYVAVPRDEAPPAIAATAQFRTLCPSSATLMAKDLG